MKFKTRKELTGYIFLSPWLVGSIFFLFIPIIYSLSLSFSKITDITHLEMNFVGLEHYKRAFLSDVDFLDGFIKILSQELLLMPMIIVFSLILAILVNSKIRLKGFFRCVFFLPVFLGTGNVMNELLNQGVDSLAMQTVVNLLLPSQVQLYIGAGATGAIITFLSSITTVLWRSGVQIILFLGGLQKIPASLYESARVDSATEWEMFWKITLPMLSPIILLNIVYTIIASFAEKSPMVTYLYTKAFYQGEFEYSAAMGWSYFIFVLLLIGIIFLVMRPFVRNSADN